MLSSATIVQDIHKLVLNSYLDTYQSVCWFSGFENVMSYNYLLSCSDGNYQLKHNSLD